MAKGIITLRNTGGGGGISSVPARIICDTTNLQTTDAVRVQSMTNPTSVETVDVVTPGEYLIFDVDGRDYYKISLVQEIDNEDVEMVSVYRTLGFGEATVVNVFDKTHLSGIQAILNSHSESTLLNLGDEVLVNVSGSYKPYIICGIDLYDTHEVILGYKYTSSTIVTVASLNFNNRTQTKEYLDTKFNSIDESDRKYIKEKLMKFNTQGGPYTCTRYLWIPCRHEVFGDYGSESPMVQFPHFSVVANRQKYTEGTTNLGGWELSSATLDWSSTYCDYVTTAGANNKQTSIQISDFFHLTADI